MFSAQGLWDDDGMIAEEKEEQSVLSSPTGKRSSISASMYDVCFEG